MVDNSALLIVEDAIKPEDLDHSALEARKSEAEKARDEADEGSEERRRAEREIARAEAFLEIQGS